jgi:hypothetical protein
MQTSSSGEVATGASPIIVLEFPKGTIGQDIGDHNFMRLRNMGGRAAEQVRVAPLVHGLWRVDFEEIHALAPSGHNGDSAILEYVTLQNGQYFSGSSHLGSPENGLVTFLELWGLIVRLPLTIEFRDGSHTRYTVQDIEYEAIPKTIRVRKGNKATSFRSVPLIETSPASDALNLIITNLSPVDMDADKLLLHGVMKWGERISQFHEVEQFKQFSTVTLYGDQIGLPACEPRRFQLLEFKNPAGPIFRARVESVGAREWSIPSHGLWRMDLELRWNDGTPYPFQQCFKWDQRAAPDFVSCPSEVKQQPASVGQ